MRTDVVIVGGGIAGLATGALLSKQGRRVTVLERGNRPGGRAYTYEERGFTINYGPHAMYRPDTGLLGQVLARLGRPRLPYNVPEPTLAYWADGDRFASLGAKPHQVLTTQLFPFTGRLRVAALMMAIRTAKPERIPAEQTFRAWVEERVPDESLRRFANALAVVNTYTRPAGELSARWLVAHLKRSLFAKDYVGYMSHGWRSIYETFIDQITTHGGSVVTSAKVDHLDVREGRVVAAFVGDQRYEAQAFVCTLPPQEAPSIALPATPLHGELSRWTDLSDARALTIELGFNRKLRDDLTFVFDVERDLYYSLHSEVTPDLAPAGSQLMHAMAYLSPEEAADDALREGRKRELTDGLDRFFEGWREAFVFERSLPNARVTSARWIPSQLEPTRVPLRSSTADNLYFAGDGRDIAYNLAEIALASAMEVADAIAKDAPLRAAPERVTA